MFRFASLSLLTLAVSSFFGFSGHAAEPPQKEYGSAMPAFDFRTQCGSATGGGFQVWAKGPDGKAFVEGQTALLLQRRAYEQAAAQAAITCPPPAPIIRCTTSSCYGLTTSSRSSCYGTTTRSCCGARTTSSCCGSRTASTTSCAGYTPTYLRYQTPPLGRAFWCNCPDHVRACAALGRTDWQGIPCQCRTGCAQCAMHPH